MAASPGPAEERGLLRADPVLPSLSTCGVALTPSPKGGAYKGLPGEHSFRGWKAFFLPSNMESPTTPSSGTERGHKRAHGHLER